MTACLIEIHAREKFGLPDAWQANIWENVGPPEAPYPFVRLTGAVYPPVAKGSRKGKPNWRKPEGGKEQVVTITPAEHDAWSLAWEEKTGKCRECMGEGRRVHGWSAIEGTSYETCPACEGIGAPRRLWKGVVS